MTTISLLNWKWKLAGVVGHGVLGGQCVGVAVMVHLHAGSGHQQDRGFERITQGARRLMWSICGNDGGPA